MLQNSEGPEIRPEKPSHIQQFYRDLAVLPKQGEEKGKINPEFRRELQAIHATRVTLSVFEAWTKHYTQSPVDTTLPPEQTILGKQQFLDGGQGLANEALQMLELMTDTRNLLSLAYPDSITPYITDGKDLHQKIYSFAEKVLTPERIQQIQNVSEITLDDSPDSLDRIVTNQKFNLVMHDLQGKMTPLLGYAQLAELKNTSEYDETILKNIHSMDEYITQEAHEIIRNPFPQIELTVGDLQKYFNNGLHPFLEFGTTSIDFKPIASTDISITWSAPWISTLLQNASMNAINSYEERDSTYPNRKTEPKSIAVHSQMGNDEHVELMIDDFGRGFSSNRLLEGFSRGGTDWQEKHEQGGTGTAMGALVFALDQYGISLVPQNIVRDANGEVIEIIEGRDVKEEEEGQPVTKRKLVVLKKQDNGEFLESDVDVPTEDVHTSLVANRTGGGARLLLRLPYQEKPAA